MAYIYKIINDINEKVYVGKTQFSLEKRFQEHCRDCQKNFSEKRPLYSAMRKYGVEHFHIELIEETDQPEEREIYWIEQLNTYKNRYNATKGGDGRSFLDENLIVQNYKKYQNVTEVAKKLSCDNRSVSFVLKKKNVSVKSGAEVTAEKASKKVAQCDKETGEILAVYPSCHEAAKAISRSHTHIIDVANGKRKTAYGYIWKFV